MSVPAQDRCAGDGRDWRGNGRDGRWSKRLLLSGGAGGIKSEDSVESGRVLLMTGCVL